MARQAFLDEAGASIDQLALGFRPTARGRAWGGVKRPSVGAV
jgi:hypothetical protein